MDIEGLRDAIVSGDSTAIQDAIKAELHANTPPEIVLKEGMFRALATVGAQFEEGEIYLPEMMVASRAFRAGVETLKPHLVGERPEIIGKVVIGTVKGDVHNLGKNLVGMMLEGSGFEVADLGVDVPVGAFVEAVDDTVDIVAMSALLTTTIPQMSTVIKALTDAGLRDKVKVLVGGGPVTHAYADQIGADGYARDLWSAVQVANGLLGLNWRYGETERQRGDCH